MKIGSTLKKIREEKGLSRNEAATLIGILPRSLWRIETDRTAPTRKVVETFCRVAEVPLARVITASLEPSDFEVKK